MGLRRRLGGAVLMVLTLCLAWGGTPAIGTPAARAATFGIGIGDIGPCTLSTSAPGCGANQSNADFERFQAEARSAPHGPVRFARMVVPWDTVATCTASSCPTQASCSAESPLPAWYGTSYLSSLEQWLQATSEAGIVPIVALGHNDPTADTGSPSDGEFPTEAQYECAFAGLVDRLISDGVPVPTEWEVFNEPDSDAGTLASMPWCAEAAPLGNGSGQGNAGQCAARYYVDAAVADQKWLGRDDVLAAGGFNYYTMRNLHPTLGNSFYEGYGDYLAQTLHRWPSIWAGHPYDDVTGGGEDGGQPGGGTKAFDTYLHGLYAGRAMPRIWLTETGDWLDDPDDPSTDGSPPDQGEAAAAFLALPAYAGTGGVQVTRIYWWEWDSPAGQPTYWDSGLIAPGDTAVRESWCVLAGESPAQANSDPGCDSAAAAEDSEDPGG